VLTSPVIAILMSTIAMCFASETAFAVFPLFAFTPIASGGLGMNEAEIGVQMAIRAVFHIGLMLFYSRTETWFGTTVRLHRTLMWMWPLSVLCIPLLNILARIYGSNDWIFNIALLGYFIVWSLSGFTWVTVDIMITDVSPSPEALAAINGLHLLAVVLPQAIAPAFVTSLFAFSIESGIAGGNLIWIILFVSTLAGAIHSMALRQTTSSWRQ